MGRTETNYRRDLRLRLDVVDIFRFWAAILSNSAIASWIAASNSTRSFLALNKKVWSDGFFLRFIVPARPY